MIIATVLSLTDTFMNATPRHKRSVLLASVVRRDSLWSAADQPLLSTCWFLRCFVHCWNRSSLLGLFLWRCSSLQLAWRFPRLFASFDLKCRSDLSSCSRWAWLKPQATPCFLWPMTFIKTLWPYDCVCRDNVTGDIFFFWPWMTALCEVMTEIAPWLKMHCKEKVSPDFTSSLQIRIWIGTGFIDQVCSGQTRNLTPAFSLFCYLG